MPKANSTLRTCAKGHKYYKSSDCPTCPICEQEKNPATGCFSTLSAPARRALKNNGINTLKQLAKFSEKEILTFHGMGPASIPTLTIALKKAKLGFRKSSISAGVKNLSRVPNPALGNHSFDMSRLIKCDSRSLRMTS